MTSLGNNGCHGNQLDTMCFYLIEITKVINFIVYARCEINWINIVESRGEGSD